MIQEHFCNYENSLTLRELGFRDFKYYDENSAYETGNPCIQNAITKCIEIIKNEKTTIE